jgi:hypothetical protein
MVGEDMRDTRQRVIRLFTFLGGIYFFLYFVLPETTVEAIGMKASHEQISNGFIVIGSMAIGLGLFNILRAHGARVVFGRPGWINSLALILGLFVTIGVMSVQWGQALGTSREVQAVQMIGEFATKIREDAKNAPGQVDTLREKILREYALAKITDLARKVEMARENGGDPVHDTLRSDVASRAGALREDTWFTGTAQGPDALQLFAQRANELASSYAVLRRTENERTLTQNLYDFLYDGLFNQLGSAMFALLGVYIAAAAYRAFRVRTVESALMMAAAVVVMLGQISFGKELSDGLPAARQWLLEVPNSAAFRAIRLGAGIAGLMLAIRMWLSIESSSFPSRRK